MSGYIAELQIKVDSSQVESATQKLKEFTKATGNVGDAEKKVREPRKADEQQVSRLLGQIDKQTKSLDKLTSQQKMLSAAHQEGKISNDVMEQYTKILNANMEIVKARGNAVDTASAKAIAAIKRESDAEENRLRKLQQQEATQVRLSAARVAREERAAAAIAAAEAKRQQVADRQAEKLAQKQAQTEQKRLSADQASRDKEDARATAQQAKTAARTEADQAKASAKAASVQARSDAKAEAARLKAENKLAAEASASEERRYKETLARYNREAQQEQRRINSEAKEKDKAAKASAAQQAKAANDSAKEQQRLDTIRYQETLRRYDNERKVAETSAKATAAAESTAKNDALKEQQRLDNIRYQSTLRLYNEEQKLSEQAARRAATPDPQVKALQALQAAIDPAYRELQRLDALEKSLQANKSKLSTEQYEKLSSKLAVARAETERYSDALGRTGLSAKQLRMAQQGLPAQITDIVVSLQGGQAPLTVLLQQGGQLKDMFGGVTPAIKGLGSALLAMVNPATVAVAALAGIVFIAQAAAAETTDFAKAVAASAGFSGVSANQFLLLQKSISSTAGTMGLAADALTAMEASGKIAAGQFAAIGTAAVKMQLVTGQEVGKTVDEFAALAKDPANAVLALNEKYNGLTSSIYAQITSLQRQGDVMGATALAQDAMAKGAAAMADNIKANLGTVEVVWKSIKDAAKEGWDAMLGVGRTQDIDTQIANKQKILDDRKTGLLGFLNLEDLGANSQSTKFIEGEIAVLKKAKAQIEATAKSQADATQSHREAVDAQNFLDAKSLSVRTQLKVLEDDLAIIRVKNAKIAEEAAKTGTKVTKEQLDQQAQIILDQEKKIQDEKDRLAKAAKSGIPKSAIIDNTEANELGNKINEIKAQYKSLNEAITQAQAAGTISTEAAVIKRKALLDQETAKIKQTYSEQIAALEQLKASKHISANQTISIDRQIADVRSKMVVAAADAEKSQAKIAGDEEKRLKRQRANIEAYRQTLEQMVADKRMAGERDRAGLSQSAGQRAVNDQLNTEDDRYTNEVRNLDNQRAENPKLAAEVEQKLQAAARAHTAMKTQIIQNYHDMQVAQRDWAAGAKSAFEQYVEDGQNYAGQTHEAFTNAFASMEDSIVSFVTTGKMSFSDLTKSILADMARIAVKSAASSALMAIFGSMDFSGSSAAGTGNAASDYSNLSNWQGPTQAKGGGWSGGTQFFAKGGAFTNTVVSKPTAFGTSTGTGVMGEKGPEAIMPLTRSSDGSLGVRASVDVGGLQQSTGGGGVNVYISIDGAGGAPTTETSDSKYEQFGKDLGNFVDQRYRTLMNKDLSPGGDIWKSTNGR